MVDVKIYTTALCSYCHQAKKFFDEKNISFDEIDVTFSPDLRAKMAEYANGEKSVPQIFIDGKHIGGCSELLALEKDGGFDALFLNNG